MRFSLLLGGLLLQLILLPSAHALESEPAFDYDRALKTSQQAIGNQIGNYSMLDAEGRPVRFNDLAGKPLVISMIFTSCHEICPMTTKYLSKMVEKARDALGKDSFSVALIGFDSASDTPEAMQYFANRQGISNKGWHLLSMKQSEVDALAKDLGFLYYPSPAGFDHLIQATVVDAQGVVYRQVYGQVFEVPQLVEPLKELVLGRPQPAEGFLAGLTKKIKLFCTTYDPVRDGYHFDYSLFIGMLIGGSIIILTGVALVREIIKNKASSHS